MKSSGIHSRSLCAVIVSPGYTWRHRSGFASGFFQVLSQLSCLSFCFRLHLNLSDFHHTATVYLELLVWDNILIWLPHYVMERISRRKNQNEKVSALTIQLYGGAALLPQPVGHLCHQPSLIGGGTIWRGLSFGLVKQLHLHDGQRGCNQERITCFG